MLIVSAQNGRAEHPGSWCADGALQRHWTHSIRVWDQQRQPAIQAVSVLELLSRYPCGEQAGTQWCAPGSPPGRETSLERFLLLRALDVARGPCIRLAACFHQGAHGDQVGDVGNRLALAFLQEVQLGGPLQGLDVAQSHQGLLVLLVALGHKVHRDQETPRNRLEVHCAQDAQSVVQAPASSTRDHPAAALKPAALTVAQGCSARQHGPSRRNRSNERQLNQK
jgi:hypothetical protein